jgi:glycosyltransferase involved in cell wall biosynthesis
MPVRNGARFLPEALADIGAQTYTNHETIVVDGGSNDNSAELALAAGARVIEQTEDGFGDACNLGVSAARGELLAFQDSDDRWAPDKLAAQVEILAARPEVDYVITHMRFFMEPGLPYPPGFRPSMLEADHVAPLPIALMIRRSSFDRVGPLRTDLLSASDTDFFARMKDLGLICEVVPRVLVRKRVHDANVTYFRAERLNRELVGLLRDSVARKRAER